MQEQPMNNCVSAFPYTGDICKEELLSQKENFFLDGQSSDILVLRNISISAVEQIAAISPECREVSMPFLCLYFSGGFVIRMERTLSPPEKHVQRLAMEYAINRLQFFPEEQSICSGISSGIYAILHIINFHKHNINHY